MFLNETLISPLSNSHFDKTSSQNGIYVNTNYVAAIKTIPIRFDSTAHTP